MTQLTFLDLCSGIGGFRLGLESAAISVWDIVNMINLQELHTKQCMIRKESGKRMMLQNLNHPMCQEQTSGALDSPVRIFQSQESSGDWSEKEVEYILTLLTSSKAKKKVISPHTFFVENVKNLLSINAGFDFATVCLKWEKQGMTVAGRCLTQKTTEFHKTESACSLSQILEAEVDEKYYLSEEKQNSS